MQEKSNEQLLFGGIMEQMNEKLTQIIISCSSQIYQNKFIIQISIVRLNKENHNELFKKFNWLQIALNCWKRISTIVAENARKKDMRKRKREVDLSNYFTHSILKNKNLNIVSLHIICGPLKIRYFE